MLFSIIFEKYGNSRGFSSIVYWMFGTYICNIFVYLKKKRKPPTSLMNGFPLCKFSKKKLFMPDW